MPYDMKLLPLDASAATSLTVLFGAIGGQTDAAPIPIPITILSTYFASVISATPGGSNTQIQYNNSGAFGGAAGITTNGTALTVSGNAAASAPPLLTSGTWFTGGSATTTKPQLLVEPSGTTSTAWSTSGTGLGVNAATGFTGNLLDLQKNATSFFAVSAAGNVTMTASSTIGTASGDFIVQAAGNLDLNSNGGFAFTIDTSGRFKAVTDNANDIGVSGANRPRNLFLAGGITHGSATLLTTTTALTNNAAAQTATLTNGPTAGNPTKWIPINDNGTTRNIPAW